MMQLEVHLVPRDPEVPLAKTASVAGRARMARTETMARLVMLASLDSPVCLKKLMIFQFLKEK